MTNPQAPISREDEAPFVLNRLYWRWSSDGTICYVEYMYRSRFLKIIKTKRVAMFFAIDWETPADARGAAENLIDRLEAQKEGLHQ